MGAAGFGLSAKFAIVKILDYEIRQEELEASQNPFASVILAQLAALKCNRKPHDQRKQIKLDLTRRLYRKGFRKKDIHNLYLFIDWLIGLPENLEVEYKNEVNKLEEINYMPYVSSIERIGRKEGYKLGKEEVAKGLLASNVDLNIIKKATGFTLEQLKSLQNDKLKENSRL